MYALLCSITIKQRLIGGFAILLALMVGMSSIQFSAAGKLGDIVDKMHRHPLTVTRASALGYAETLKISLLVAKALSEERRNNDTNVSQQVLESKKMLNEHLSIINERILGEEGKALAKHTTELANSWLLNVDSILLSQFSNSQLREQYQQQEQELQEKFVEMVEYARVKGDGFYTTSKASISASNRNALVILILAILCGFVIAVFVYKSIVIPLSKLITAIKLVEETSDLGGRVQFESACEVGSMARAFNNMMKKIENSVKKAMQSSTDIQSLNKAFSQQTHVISDSISNQYSEVDEVASSISQLSESISVVARNAENTLESVNTANSYADKGEKAISDMTSNISRLLQSSENSTQTVNQLKNDADDIGSILDVIKGIAEQTNLLALNAAIEAARAGDQGRGFAVVADEVRTLAQRTAVSTGEIQQTIEKLQRGTEQVVDAIENSTTIISESDTQASVVTHEIRQIRDLMSAISTLNSEMADSTRDQVNVSDNVNQRIQTISVLAKGANDSTQQLEQQNDKLLHQNEQLSQAMQQFKVT